ncbi:MAG: tRNA (adenosine(37)-N6)-threonylcarbamoyltransferase complex ATPase subunit type 1 TsaE [Lactobacillales bacterium]|jgi:tRNA threonylcarbamoyladenosine biosynthesis protein TsaE|nr:tRNA (adenosine(37)-N6)-threonylcarbamoyltransferase complex ATPase subunit type 1 TsaE [Lactobacillales bacterium]
MKKILKDIKETERLAKKIGKIALPQDILILTGDLGAGKTTFTKGIAQGLGIKQMIKSPTYTIMREYRDGRIPLFHMDLYRVEMDADELGLEEYFASNGLSVVEWGKMLAELPESYIEIILKKGAKESQRIVDFQAFGLRGKKFYQRIVESSKNLSTIF